MDTVRIVDVVKKLGIREWKAAQPHGPHMWFLNRVDGQARIIVTCGPTTDPDDGDWLHASISRPNRMPTYADLIQLHEAVFGDRWAYQVFAPPAAHVNIHPYALHLWGKPDGARLLPNFGRNGTI